MGVDFGGSGPVYALGNAVITNATGTSAGWPGGGWITYKLTDGPDAGLLVYLAEDVTPTRAGRPARVVRHRDRQHVRRRRRHRDRMGAGKAASPRNRSSRRPGASVATARSRPGSGSASKGSLQSLGVPAAPNRTQAPYGLLLPPNYPAIGRIRDRCWMRTFNQLPGTRATFLAWTNSAPAAWSTPFATAASTRTCSEAASASSASACRWSAAARTSGTTDGNGPASRAQVMRDGMLVGFVNQIEVLRGLRRAQDRSTPLHRTDYDQPVARHGTVAPRPVRPSTREGGLLPPVSPRRLPLTGNRGAVQHILALSRFGRDDPALVRDTTSTTLPWSTVPGSRSGSWLSPSAPRQRVSVPAHHRRSPAVAGRPVRSARGSSGQLLRRPTSIRGSPATSRPPGSGTPP